MYVCGDGTLWCKMRKAVLHRTEWREDKDIVPERERERETSQQCNG